MSQQCEAAVLVAGESIRCLNRTRGRFCFRHDPDPEVAARRAAAYAKTGEGNRAAWVRGRETPGHWRHRR